MRGAGVVPGQSPERGINRLRGDEMSGLPTTQTQLEGQRLLQLRVLCFRFLQDGDVGVGVFPEREEIFVGGERPDASGIRIRALRSSRPARRWRASHRRANSPVRATPGDAVVVDRKHTVSFGLATGRHRLPTPRRACPAPLDTTTPTLPPECLVHSSGFGAAIRDRYRSQLLLPMPDQFGTG